MNSDSPTWKTVLRPIRSASAPENISSPASTIVYDATVHWSPDTPACSVLPIAGSPTFTTVLSRPTMNRLMQHTASISVRRPLLTGGGAISGPAVRCGSHSGALSDRSWGAFAGACMDEIPT